MTGADDIRVPDVRVTIADDEASDASCIGRAQDGPQIAGFLKPFSDHIERQTRHRESGQSRLRLRGNAQNAIGVIAVANFAEDCRADLLECNPSTTGALQQVGMVVGDLLGEVNGS